MAVAQDVTGDVPNLAWVEVVDRAGVKYRYVQRTLAPAGAILHVGYGVVGTNQAGNPLLVLRLERDQQGNVLLRQDGPGLPEKIVVIVRDRQGWEGLYEYELTAHSDAST
jgi:hypothetical protein